MSAASVTAMPKLMTVRSFGSEGRMPTSASPTSAAELAIVIARRGEDARLDSPSMSVDKRITKPFQSKRSAKFLGLGVGNEVANVTRKFTFCCDGGHFVTFTGEIVVAVVGLVKKNDAHFSVRANSFEV